VTYLSESAIKAAIDEWAESQVDANIAEQIELNKKYNEKYANDDTTPRWGSYRRPVYPTEVEQFDREEIRDEIAEEFYNEMPSEGIELPGLGLATLVDEYGGEGQGDDWWRVFKIGDDYYKADHFYSSYDTEPWHSDCTIFPVVGREKVVTEWVSAK
jgi:hypothetical protein